ALTISGTGSAGSLVTEIGPGATMISSYFGGFDSIRTVVIQPGITELSHGAFEDCENLESVTLPNTLTSIGENAFGWCKCLQSITIPDSVVSIGEDAFRGSGLRSIYIGTGLETVGEDAFESTNIESVYITDVDSWAQIEYEGDDDSSPIHDTHWVTLYLNNTPISGNIVLSNGVSKIGDFAFICCSGITGITIPNTVTSIGEDAFHGCIGLTSVTIPSGVTSIGAHAFSGCTGLTSVTIRGSLSEIPYLAFKDCSSLESITIQNGPSRIGGAAFDGCSSLASITIPATVTSIGSAAFAGCAELTQIVIPNSVTEIGYSAFLNCTSLESATLPSGLTKIDYRTFYGCESLESIVIPANVTEIGREAFKGCRSLTSVSIPASVTSIGERAFDGGVSLEYIFIPDSVTQIDSTAFGSGSNSDITIACYKDSAAQTFANAYGFNVELLIKVDSENLRIANATATVSDSTITLTPAQGATQVSVYPTLKDGTALTFTNLSGGAAVSKNGTLYAKGNGSATATAGGTAYTIVFDFGAEEIALEDNIKFANATASISGTTITLTPAQGATTVSFYPTLKDGSAVAFSDRTGGASVSKSGTLYSKGNGSAVVTIGGTAYTIVFDFGSQPVAIEDNIRYANATATVSGTTITLTPAQGATTVSFYPTLKDGSAVAFSDRTGGAAVSKSGTLYSRGNGSATATAGGTAYTIVFAFPQTSKPINELIRTANANVSVSGTTITLTAINNSTQISLYPTTTDGDTVAFSNLSVAKVSKSGTCYAKANASCEITVNGDVYTVNFVF
ncbi:MAG: leucine-rich repeat protein, partial [Clostridia bacterium]|nr:leucine-rich repeat protein [Clostridia bacterium]